jgi:predicted site-specific integrase-resolvase
MNKSYSTKTQPTPLLLSTQQAADAWGISRWSLYDLVKAGKIRPIVGMGKGWKFFISDINPIDMERL